MCMREENTGEVEQWAVSPTPHITLIGAQAHSDAAAGLGI